MKPSFTLPSDGQVKAAEIAVFDHRIFFEKALQHGIAQKIIGPAECDRLCADAPKGMVQIARYFGSEYLRPTLEKARLQLVSLVSLQLEQASGGDLSEAARLLREVPLLAHSKAGSDLLRTLLAMPQTEQLDVDDDANDKAEDSTFRQSQAKRQLEDWSLKPFADYQAEKMQRQQVQLQREAALWFANFLQVPLAVAQSSGWFAGPVICTALLVLAAGESRFPDRQEFEKIIARLRARHAFAKTSPAAWSRKSALKIKSELEKSLHFLLALPKTLPAQFQAIAQMHLQEVSAALPVILDSGLSLHALFETVDSADATVRPRSKTAPLLGQFVWIEDIASEITAYDEAVSSAWQAAFGGYADESAVLTYCLCLAAGHKGTAALSEKSAAALLRKIQKNGLLTQTAQQFIRSHAPAAYCQDFLELWDGFVTAHARLLQSDAPGASVDALALLRRECLVV